MPDPFIAPNRDAVQNNISRLRELAAASPKVRDRALAEADKLEAELNANLRQETMERGQFQLATMRMQGQDIRPAHAETVMDTAGADIPLSMSPPAGEDGGFVGGAVDTARSMAMRAGRGLAHGVADVLPGVVVSPEKAAVYQGVIDELDANVQAGGGASKAGSLVAGAVPFAGAALTAPLRAAAYVAGQEGATSYGDARGEMDLDPAAAALRAAGRGGLAGASMLVNPVSKAVAPALVRGSPVRAGAINAAAEVADSIPQSVVYDYGGAAVDVGQGRARGDVAQEQRGVDAMSQIPENLDEMALAGLVMGAGMGAGKRMGEIRARRGDLADRQASPWRQNIIEQRVAGREAEFRNGTAVDSTVEAAVREEADLLTMGEPTSERETAADVEARNAQRAATIAANVERARADAAARAAQLESTRAARDAEVQRELDGEEMVLRMSERADRRAAKDAARPRVDDFLSRRAAGTAVVPERPAGPATPRTPMQEQAIGNVRTRLRMRDEAAVEADEARAAEGEALAEAQAAEMDRSLETPAPAPERPVVPTPPKPTKDGRLPSERLQRIDDAISQAEEEVKVLSATDLRRVDREAMLAEALGQRPGTVRIVQESGGWPTEFYVRGNDGQERPGELNVDQGSAYKTNLSAAARERAGRRAKLVKDIPRWKAERTKIEREEVAAERASYAKEKAEAAAKQKAADDLYARRMSAYRAAEAEREAALAVRDKRRERIAQVRMDAIQAAIDRGSVEEGGSPPASAPAKADSRPIQPAPSSTTDYRAMLPKEALNAPPATPSERPATPAPPAGAGGDVRMPGVRSPGAGAGLPPAGGPAGGGGPGPQRGGPAVQAGVDAPNPDLVRQRVAEVGEAGAKAEESQVVEAAVEEQRVADERLRLAEARLADLLRAEGDAAQTPGARADLAEAKEGLAKAKLERAREEVAAAQAEAEAAAAKVTHTRRMAELAVQKREVDKSIAQGKAAGAGIDRDRAYAEAEYRSLRTDAEGVAEKAALADATAEQKHAAMRLAEQVVDAAGKRVDVAKARLSDLDSDSAADPREVYAAREALAQAQIDLANARKTKVEADNRLRAVKADQSNAKIEALQAEQREHAERLLPDIERGARATFGKDVSAKVDANGDVEILDPAGKRIYHYRMSLEPHPIKHTDLEAWWDSAGKEAIRAWLRGQVGSAAERANGRSALKMLGGKIPNSAADIRAELAPADIVKFLRKSGVNAAYSTKTGEAVIFDIASINSADAFEAAMHEGNHRQVHGLLRLALRGQGAQEHINVLAKVTGVDPKVEGNLIPFLEKVQALYAHHARTMALRGSEAAKKGNPGALGRAMAFIGKQLRRIFDFSRFMKKQDPQAKLSIEDVFNEIGAGKFREAPVGEKAAGEAFSSKVPGQESLFESGGKGTIKDRADAIQREKKIGRKDAEAMASGDLSQDRAASRYGTMESAQAAGREQSARVEAHHSEMAKEPSGMVFAFDEAMAKDIAFKSDKTGRFRPGDKLVKSEDGYFHRVRDGIVEDGAYEASDLNPLPFRPTSEIADAARIVEAARESSKRGTPSQLRLDDLIVDSTQRRIFDEPVVGKGGRVVPGLRQQRLVGDVPGRELPLHDAPPAKPEPKQETIFSTRVPEDESRVAPSPRERLEETAVGRAVTRTGDWVANRGKDAVEGVVKAAGAVGKAAEKLIPRASEASEKTRVLAVRKNLRETDPAKYAKLMGDEPTEAFSARVPQRNIADLRRDLAKAETPEEAEKIAKRIERVDRSLGDIPEGHRGVAEQARTATAAQRETYAKQVKALDELIAEKGIAQVRKEAIERGRERMGRLSDDQRDIATLDDIMVQRDMVTALDKGNIRQFNELMLSHTAFGEEAGRRLAFLRDQIETPAQRRGAARKALLAPSPATVKALKKLDRRMRAAEARGDDTGARKAGKLFDEMLDRLEASQKRRLTRIKKATGLDLEDAATLDQLLGDKEAFSTNLAHLENMAHYADPKTTVVDWIVSNQRAGLLSDIPTTQTQQFVGNLASLLSGTARQLIRRPGAVMAAMRGDLLVKVLSNAKESYQLGRNAFVERMLNIELGRGDVDGTRNPEDFYSRALRRISFDIMAAIDGAAQRYNAELEMAAMSYDRHRKAGMSMADARRRTAEDLTANDTSEEMAEAVWRSLPSTFQELSIPRPHDKGTGMDKLLSWATHTTNTVDELFGEKLGELGVWFKDKESGAHLPFPITKIMLPFVRTPIALANAAMRHSPAGLLHMGLAWRRLQAAKEGGGDVEWAKEELWRRSYETVLLGMIGMHGLAYALEATGTNGEPDFDKTIEIAGQRIGYSRIEPFATPLAMAANGIKAMKDGKGFYELPLYEASALLKMGSDLAWFRTAEDIVMAVSNVNKESRKEDGDVVSKAGDEVGTMAAKAALGIVPVIGTRALRGPLSGGDELTRAEDGPVGYVKGEYGIDRTVKRDVWGQPLRRGPLDGELGGGELEGLAERAVQGALGRSRVVRSNEVDHWLKMRDVRVPDWRPEGPDGKALKGKQADEFIAKAGAKLLESLDKVRKSRPDITGPELEQVVAAHKRFATAVVKREMFGVDVEP